MSEYLIDMLSSTDIFGLNSIIMDKEYRVCLVDTLNHISMVDALTKKMLSDIVSAIVRHQRIGKSDHPLIHYHWKDKTMSFKILLHHSFLMSVRHPNDALCYNRYFDALARFNPTAFPERIRKDANHRYYLRQFVRLYQNSNLFGTQFDGDICFIV